MNAPSNPPAEPTIFDTIRAEAVPAKVVLPKSESFDYGDIALDIRSELQAIAGRVRSHHRQVLADIVTLGGELLKAKSLLEHGKFLPWVVAEFAWTERTAQTYMGIAERVGLKYEALRYLPISEVAALASKSTPSAVRDEVIERSAAGERFDSFTMRTMIADARDQDRKEKAEARKTPEQRQKEKQKAGRSRQARLAHLSRIEREHAEQRALDQRHRERVTEAMSFLQACLTAEELERFREMIAGIPYYKLGEPLSSMR